MNESSNKNIWEDLVAFLNNLSDLAGFKSKPIIGLDLTTQQFLGSVLNTLNFVYRKSNIPEFQKREVKANIEKLEKILFGRELIESNIVTNETLNLPKKENTEFKYSAKRDKHSTPQSISAQQLIWNIANSSNKHELYDLLNQWKDVYSQHEFKAGIKESPSSGDLILYGTASNDIDDKLLYLAPITSLKLQKDNPLFDRYREKNVWLSFEKKWNEKPVNEEVYPYLENRFFFRKLFNEWSNFLNWIPLAPKTVILFDSKMNYLSDKLNEYYGRLLIHDANLKKALATPVRSNNFPSKLHYIYTVMCGQILGKHSLSKFNNQITVFERTKQTLNTIKKDCLKDLSLNEEKPIELDLHGNYLPEVKSYTQDNIQIKNEFKSFLGVKSNEKNKVIFWHQPLWSLDATDRNLTSTYKGGVLYI